MVAFDISGKQVNNRERSYFYRRLTTGVSFSFFKSVAFLRDSALSVEMIEYNTEEYIDMNFLTLVIESCRSYANKLQDF